MNQNLLKMLFEEKHFGNPISKQLSTYIAQHTSKQDRADVATRTGVSMSTIRDVTYRVNNLTESNSIAILEIMKIAVKNCSMEIYQAKEAKDYLLGVLGISDLAE